jgi:DNA primase
MGRHESIYDLKQSLDLASIVEGAGIELKRSGSRNVGTCPFHSDETPSFCVFPDGHFKCFGCGEHGDVIDFVQRFHNCDFKEALSILGIRPEGLTPEKREELKQLQRQRERVKAFRKWEVDASNEAGMLCRCARKVLGNIKTEADLETYGHLYHGLESWQYHLDILVGNDDEAKLGLYNAGLY